MAEAALLAKGTGIPAIAAWLLPVHASLLRTLPGKLLLPHRASCTAGPPSVGCNTQSTLFSACRLKGLCSTRSRQLSRCQPSPSLKMESPAHRRLRCSPLMWACECGRLPTDHHVPDVCRLHQLRRLPLTSQVGQCLYQILISPCGRHSLRWLADCRTVRDCCFCHHGQGQGVSCQQLFLRLPSEMCTMLARPLSTRSDYI